MGSPVMHFEIGGPDGPALQQFYRDLFGWKVDVQSAEMGNYGLVSANEGGIGGGLLPTTDGMPVRSYVTFYVQVDDIQVALDKLAGMGGNPIMPPMEIAPGMGHIAMFADPAGNSIGLYSLPSEWDGEMPPKGNDPPVVHFEVGAATQRRSQSSTPECSTGKSIISRMPTTASCSRNREGLAAAYSSTQRECRPTALPSRFR